MEGGRDRHWQVLGVIVRSLSLFLPQSNARKQAKEQKLSEDDCELCGIVYMLWLLHL